MNKRRKTFWKFKIGKYLCTPIEIKLKKNQQ